MLVSEKLAVPIHYNLSSKLVPVSGEIQEEKLVANGNGGVSHKRKHVREDWKFPEDGKHVVHQTDESMSHFTTRNFELHNSNGRSPETNETYNRLLKEGR